MENVQPGNTMYTVLVSFWCIFCVLFKQVAILKDCRYLQCPYIYSNCTQDTSFVQYFRMTFLLKWQDKICNLTSVSLDCNSSLTNVSKKYLEEVQYKWNCFCFLWFIYLYIYFLTRKLVGNGYHSHNQCEFILRCEVKTKLYEVCVVMLFFKKKFVGHMSIFGTTGTPVSDSGDVSSGFQSQSG